MSVSADCGCGMGDACQADDFMRPAVGAGTRIRYVYVAGPITKGDQAVNVRAAIDAADALMRAGFTPFVPHLSWFAHLVHPTEYEDWLAYDFAWLQRCDALVRIPGESAGADREMVEARRLGLSVFESIHALLGVTAC